MEQIRMPYMNFQGPNFSLEVPTDWVVSSSPQFQAIFLGPLYEPVRPNVLVSLRPVEEGVTPEAVAESARETQEREYPGYEVLGEVDYREHGGIGIARSYRWVNPTNKVPVIQTQAFFVFAKILFTLTSTRAEDVSEETARELDEVFDHMLQTFRILA